MGTLKTAPTKLDGGYGNIRGAATTRIQKAGAPSNFQPIKPKAQENNGLYTYGPKKPDAPFAPQRSGKATNNNLADRAANPGPLKTKTQQQAYDNWTMTDSKGTLHTLPQKGPSSRPDNKVYVSHSSVPGPSHSALPSRGYSPGMDVPKAKKKK